MKKIFYSVMNNPLFRGIGYSDFEKMSSCICARTQRYEKEDIILLAGDGVNFVGIIMSGGVKVIREDMEGNASILTRLGPPELFGEVFACAGIVRSPVTVQASEKSEILFLDFSRVITTCSATCGFHSRLIENMLRIIAEKNLMLNQKIDILSKRTTREKLIRFFEIQGGASKKFSVPYNREEMARYLCVDRSALSNELGKMRDEGIINFHKNEFEIL